MTIVPCRGGPATIHWVVVLLVAALSRAGYSQMADTVRTWTDSSGRHRTEASFVRLDDKDVYLKLGDGRVVAIPLARLSETDRKHAAALAKQISPEIPSDAGSLAALSATGVVVWRQTGERSWPFAGIVVDKKGDLALVLTQGSSRPLTSDPKDEVSYRIAVADADPGQRVAAEWFADRWSSRMLLATPADQLPVPLAAQTPVEAVEGRLVVVTGFQTTTGSPPSATRYRHTGMIHRVFRTLDGKVTRIRVELSKPPPTFSVVADDRGRFVGVLQWQPVRQTLRRPSSRPEPPPRFFMVTCAETFFDRLRRPLEKHVSFALKGQQDNTRTFQFVTFVSDPFEQIRNPQLRIRPAKKLEHFPETLLGADRRTLQTDIPPLKMLRQRPDESLSNVFGGYALHGQRTTFVADFETTTTEYGYHAQFVHETADGQSHYGRLFTVSQSRPRPQFGRP